jgi:hypothetical protein
VTFQIKLTEQLDSLMQRFPNCEARSSRGERVVCMRVLFILNEIWAQDKICILIGTMIFFYKI